MGFAGGHHQEWSGRDEHHDKTALDDDLRRVRAWFMRTAIAGRCADQNRWNSIETGWAYPRRAEPGRTNDGRHRSNRPPETRRERREEGEDSNSGVKGKRD